MTKLLKRINGKICVQKENKLYEPIELESLVHTGSELIGFNAKADTADKVAKTMALALGQEYCCDYVLVGSNNLEFNRVLKDVPNYVYIATFYNEKKKAVLRRLN